MEHPAAANFGPIYWIGPAAVEAGLSRSVRKPDIDRIWSPLEGKCLGCKSPENRESLKKRQQQIIEAARQLPDNKELGDAVRDNLGLDRLYTERLESNPNE